MEHKEAVFSGQGTRLSEKAPWETYQAEMTERLTPQLEKAVAEYAEKRYDVKPSNQNLEELAEQKELSNSMSKEYQFMSPEEYADTGARIGRVMDHATFISILRGTGLACHYRQHVHLDKVVLWAQPPRAPGADFEKVCWVQYGQMPELSIMNFDEHGVPLAERRRGWRTCLLQTVLGGYLTEEAAIKAYGRPKESEQFHRYNAMLQSFRNAGSSLGE